MKKLILVFAFAAFMIPMMAAGQSAFNGTWKIDANKASLSKKPWVLLLQDGMYACKTCDFPFNIKADGTDQKVDGHPYADTDAAQVINDHEIKETYKKGGEVVATSDSVVSADGNRLIVTSSDSSDTNGGPPVTGKMELTRLEKGPAGSHLISGSWQFAKLVASDNALVWSYKVNGDEITMTSQMGQSYTAKVNGPDAPMKGDPGIDSVSLKMPDKNTLEETDKHNGKVVWVGRLKVAADGKTGKLVAEDKLNNDTSEFEVTKQ